MKTVRHWRRERTHPLWCDVTRCLTPYAGLLGEHRSEPMTRVVPGYGAVTATLTQKPGHAARLEITVSAPVPAVDPDGQRAWAGRLLANLGLAITRATHTR